MILTHGSNSIARGGSGNYAEIAGRLYKITTINGVTWMAENLDFVPASGVLINPDSAPDVAAVYWKNESYRQNYGILYNKAACDYIEANKDALIPGWHVPTKTEYESLITAVGGSSVAGSKLKSVDGWDTYAGHSGGGTGEYEFEALPAGQRTSSKEYISEKREADIWSLTSDGPYFAYTLVLNYSTNSSSMSTLTTSYGCSLRLVKD